MYHGKLAFGYWLLANVKQPLSPNAKCQMPVGSDPFYAMPNWTKNPIKNGLFFTLFYLHNQPKSWYDFCTFQHKILRINMQIIWHGYSSVRIESKNGELSSTLLTDPFENETSIRFPRTIEPDIVVLGHQDRKRFNLAAVQGNPFLISDPGEYEVKGVFVYGIQDPSIDGGKDRPIIYRFMTEGMSIAFLGQLNRKLTNFELEQLENIDILLLPVGGGEALDADKAADLITVIEPRVVVPLNYSLPGMKKKLGSVDEFCKHLGASNCENMTKLKIQRKDLPAETLLVAVLDRT